MGRPKGSPGRCGYCRKFGHNKKNCPVDPDNMGFCTGCNQEMHDSCFEDYRPRTHTLCYICFPEKAKACRICGGLGHNYKTCTSNDNGTFHCNGCKQLLPPDVFIMACDPMSPEWVPTCAKCYYEQSKNRIVNSPRNYLMVLLHRAKNNRASKKAPKLAVDIDIDFLVWLLEEQQGLCFYTGLPMTTHAGIWAISLDRVDSSLGYLKENVVLCATQVNQMKGTLSGREFIALSRIIVEHNADYPSTSISDLDNTAHWMAHAPSA